MEDIKVFALGGLDEDGKNCYVIEIDKDIFVIECGLKYPDTDKLGIEMIIPDFKYLQENKERVKGVFITHANDDVMAGVVRLTKLIQAPIYTAPFTARIIEKRLKEEKIKKYKIHEIQRNDVFKIGKISVRTFGITNSIVDAFGIAIQTKHGYIVYSGELVFDYDIKNNAFKCDITQMASIGNDKVLLLMNESVAATRAGHSAPHHRIAPIIEQQFEETNNRICVTLYNQNLYRVIEVIELAAKYNRKIVIYDEELDEMLSELEKLGYYTMPKKLKMPLKHFKNDMENVCVIIAGSGSNIFKKVLTIATKEDRVIELRPTDTVIIASPSVPGTERDANRMENCLYKEGVKVFTVDKKRIYSMHAAVEDLKMLLYLFKPRYYMPVKGEYRQLISNANIAVEMGYHVKDILVMDNGQIAKIENGLLESDYRYLKLEDVLVDGNDSLDASGMVLRDRETLSTDGVIIVGVVLNYATKKIIGGPDVQSRGVIYLKDADHIVKHIGEMIESTIEEAVKNGTYDNMNCRLQARDAITKYVLKETGKRPMVLPAIIEINSVE